MEQTDPPRSAKETLPTMYDLLSEDPQEPGCRGEFHDFQPQLLRETFRPPHYSPEQVFVASGLNLYYDVRHPLWCKRPDWFAVLGVERLYEGRDLRMSYVMWQEGVAPAVVVELLSPGTEREDLGRTQRGMNQPPTQWEVYEQILRVPYYVVFDRYSDRLRAFTLTAGQYREELLEQLRFFLPSLNLGLGLWQGSYQGIDRQWLRWYDDRGNWIPTATELERAQKETAQARAERLAERLRAMGVDPDAPDGE
ncbi:Uma2 family endonuclease [Chroococcidiopsis sp. FACHB-1243]|nr:Uma2 family endonuclease [Chroococcidiopsis sp. [FACHB-1243]]